MKVAQMNLSYIISSWWHCTLALVENSEDVLQRYEGEVWVAARSLRIRIRRLLGLLQWIRKKTQFFLNTTDVYEHVFL